MQKLFILAALLFAPALPGCVLAAAAGAGVIVGQTSVEGDTCIAHVRSDVNRVWAQTKISLNQMTPKPIDVDNDLRSATASIDNATIKVTVETFDLNVSVVRVSGRRYGMPSYADAKIAFDRLMADLNRKP